MEPIYFFNAVRYLEPKCPKCRNKLDYGVSTNYSEKLHAHTCTNCGEVIE